MYFHHRSPMIGSSSIEPTNLPESLDWRTKDVITPVRDIARPPLVAQVRLSVGILNDNKARFL
jgi:hypothetical protein